MPDGRRARNIQVCYCFFVFAFSLSLAHARQLPPGGSLEVTEPQRDRGAVIDGGRRVRNIQICYHHRLRILPHRFAEPPPGRSLKNINEIHHSLSLWVAKRAENKKNIHPKSVDILGAYQKILYSCSVYFLFAITYCFYSFHL